MGFLNSVRSLFGRLRAPTSNPLPLPQKRWPEERPKTGKRNGAWIAYTINSSDSTTALSTQFLTGHGYYSRPAVDRYRPARPASPSYDRAGDGQQTENAPRWIVPRGSALVPQGTTRTFWLTIKTPPDARAGEYRGNVRIAAEGGGEISLPLRLTVRNGSLDPVDLPAGPFSHTIDLPWYDDETAAHNREMASRSLAKLREYGFTTASGLPAVRYLGFRSGKPQFDFSRADAPMELFRRCPAKRPNIQGAARQTGRINRRNPLTCVQSGEPPEVPPSNETFHAYSSVLRCLDYFLNILIALCGGGRAKG